MTTPAHTPGPWKAALPVGNPPFVSNEGTVVVQKVGPFGDEHESHANAHLFADIARWINAMVDSYGPGNPAWLEDALALLARIDRTG